MRRIALRTAGSIFLLIALMHALRLFYKVEILVSDRPVSGGLSVAAGLIALLLSVWMFFCAKES